MVEHFPTQHWELETDEYQEMMLSILGRFCQKNKLKDVPEKKWLCHYLQHGQAGEQLHAQRAAQCQPPLPQGVSPVPPQHPRFKPSPRSSALLQCWLPWMGPCLHTRFQSLAQVNPGSLEITILPTGLGSLFNEEATLCAAKGWQGRGMGCHVCGARSLQVLSAMHQFPPLSKNPCRLAWRTAVK